MMATKSKIEWTDATWNPVTGRTKISRGCARCYAERMAYRFAGCNGYPHRPQHFDVTLHPQRLERPLRWRKPRRVFVCSMSDLFHEDVPDSYIDRVFEIMIYSAARQLGHTFQVLTKRPERMLAWFNAGRNRGGDHVPLHNLWLGVTCENQEQSDKRIPYLLQTPAAVRFVSVEPMLGPVDIEHFLGDTFSSLYGGFSLGLDWVICGGESGPGAQPMHPDWARALRDQCASAGVPFFFKQWGAWHYDPQFSQHNPVKMYMDRHGNFYSGTTDERYRDGLLCFDRVGKHSAGRLLDGREWNEFPA